LLAFLEITNLADRRNQCCYDYDVVQDEQSGENMLERSYDYWLPLLPAVGFLWQF